MIAGWAGCDQVAPLVCSTLAARDDVIDSHMWHFITAVLTGEIISPQNLTLAQFDTNTRPFDHHFQAYDRGTREFCRYGMDVAATVQDESRFTGHHQSDRSTSVTDIQWLEIGI
jgi:hypothetical protein